MSVALLFILPRECWLKLKPMKWWSPAQSKIWWSGRVFSFVNEESTASKESREIGAYSRLNGEHLTRESAAQHAQAVRPPSALAKALHSKLLPDVRPSARSMKRSIFERTNV